MAIQQGRIGSDEAGKGDYFGPLVAAAVWADEEMENLLLAQGIKDSKFAADTVTRRLSLEISRLCPNHVVSIFPTKYNELISRMSNLNSLLAWAHARAIESLLEKLEERGLSALGEITVIADQFGDENYLKNALMQRGRRARLVQRTKAEQEPVVAAASMLARAGFLDGLSQLSQECGITLPKGASNVLPTGRAVVAYGGVALLEKVAKIHFRTTKQVLRE